MHTSAAAELLVKFECFHGNTEPQVNQSAFLESDQDVVIMTLLSLYRPLT